MQQESNISLKQMLRYTVRKNQLTEETPCSNILTIFADW